MEIIIFALILYILIGTIRVVYDFAHRSITSAPYIREPKTLIILTVILIWSLFPIGRFIEQRRRMNFRFIFDFYLIPLFYGLAGYSASLLGFSKILGSDSEIYIKLLKIAGILVIYSAVIWWLFYRLEEKKEKLINNIGRK